MNSTSKRKNDEPETPVDTGNKKMRPEDDALLSSNFYSPLLHDKGDEQVITKNTQQKAKNPYLPPIILHQELINPKSTYQKIQSWAKNPVYFKANGQVCHIHATNKDDFIVIKEQLTALDFKWTGHKAQDDIPKKLVLKGIDRTYTDEEVLDDLKQQYEYVSAVKQMTTLKDGKHLPIGVYLVYGTQNYPFQ